MQQSKLSKLEFISMTDIEMVKINGGTKWPKWLKGLGVGWLVDQVISNWDEIKEGFREGYNARV